MDGLNEKQATFVREYLKERNVTAAAVKAGYSPRTAPYQGSRLLKNVKVSSAINALSEKATRKALVDAEYVISGLREVAERCRQPETFDPAGANRSLELLGKHLKLFTDKVEEKSELKVLVVREERSLDADGDD